MDQNVDPRTVKGFGDEWTRFDQSQAPAEDLQRDFAAYFGIFPKQFLQSDKTGIDAGCGSGRWGKFVAPLVGKLICIDASAAALDVARRNLSAFDNVEYIHASVSEIPLPDASIDFAYSLGVMHHIPDTLSGVREVVRALKPGSPFLIYLYYDFENRPGWYRAMWKLSEPGRHLVSSLPFEVRKLVADAVAVTVYWPLARAARAGEVMGWNVEMWPLTHYRRKGFYGMRTDALDRFGTPLEKRFSRQQITAMLESAGLERVEFSNTPPFWCAVAYKKNPSA